MARLLFWLGPFERFWRDRLTALGSVLDAMPDDDSALSPDGTTAVVSEDDDE